MRKNSKNIDIDFNKLVEVFNEGGREVAEEYIKRTYDIDYYLAIRRLTHETGYHYNRRSKKYELKLTGESQFMSVEELCSDDSAKPVKIHDTFSMGAKVGLEVVLVDLMRDRLLEISKYFSIEQSSRKITINLQSLKKSGYEVTII